MKFSEEQLKWYAEPISDTEDEQCKNAVRMVGDALKELGFRDKDSIRRAYDDSSSYELRMLGANGYDVKIFMQGSYANNTNVRGYSDVDIAVVQEDIFQTEYRIGAGDDNYGIVSAGRKDRSFKDVVEEALIKKFGDDVERKNKSIKIYGNNYRKDADSVPAMRYRNYSMDYSNNIDNYIPGIIIVPDYGERIINYPEVHLKNGIEKNKSTNYYFKKMVRIAKEMRCQMEEKGYNYAKKATSFNVECLLWNIPDGEFLKHDSYRMKFKNIVDYLYITRLFMFYFKEVNDIKYIGEDDKERERVCKGFIEELERFYEYEF
ncbi:MAG: nucleotidyltransferase [Ruminococcaceae bacterium]|nr:nucleotidyltransferase [Oscillospiraceae bacterium]